jgi:hypothetical protein
MLYLLKHILRLSNFVDIACNIFSFIFILVCRKRSYGFPIFLMTHSIVVTASNNILRLRLLIPLRVNRLIEKYFVYVNLYSFNVMIN